MLMSGKMRMTDVLFSSAEIYLVLTEDRLFQLKQFISYVKRRVVSLKPLNDEDVLHDHLRDFVDNWIDGETDIEFVVIPYELEAGSLPQPLVSKEAIDAFGLTSDTYFHEFRIGSTVSLPYGGKQTDGDDVWQDSRLVNQLFERDTMRLLFEPAANAISEYSYRKHHDSRTWDCLAVFRDCNSYAFLDDECSEVLDVAIDTNRHDIADGDFENMLQVSFRLIERAYDVLERESGLTLSAARKDLSETMHWEGLEAAYQAWMQRITKRNGLGKKMLGAAVSNYDHAMKDVDYIEVALTVSGLEAFADAFFDAYSHFGESASNTMTSNSGRLEMHRSLQFQFKEHSFNIIVMA